MTNLKLSSFCSSFSSLQTILVSFGATPQAHHKLHGSQFGNNSLAKFYFHRFV
jgi:hypothetical protein